MNVEAYAKKHDLGTLLELLSVELLSKRPQSPLSYLEELCRKVSAAKHAKGVSTAAIVSETLESVVAQIKGTEAATKEEKAATPREFRPHQEMMASKVNRGRRAKGIQIASALRPRRAKLER